MSSLLHLNFCQSMHISGLRPSPFSPAWFLPITVINLQIDYRVQQCFAYLHHWGSQVRECRTCCNSEALLLCNPLLFLTSVSINRSRLKKITRLPVHCLSSCWTSKRTLWQNGYLMYGKRLKREICFRRNEIFFCPKMLGTVVKSNMFNGKWLNS